MVPENILEYIWKKADQAHQREHCLDYIWDNPSHFNIGMLIAPKSIRRPDVRLDIDTGEDLFLIRKILTDLNYDQVVHLNTQEIIKIYDEKGTRS